MVKFKKLSQIEEDKVGLTTIRVKEACLIKKGYNKIFHVMMDKDPEVLTNSKERKAHFESSRKNKKWFKSQIAESWHPDSISVGIADEDHPLEFLTVDSYPILKIQGKSYFIQCFRDIYPTGWLMPGGCPKGLKEIINPVKAINREMTEEVVLADKNGYAYALTVDNRFTEIMKKNIEDWKIKAESVLTPIAKVLEPSNSIVDEIKITYFEGEEQKEVTLKDLAINIDCEIGSISVGLYLQYTLADTVKFSDIRLFDGERFNGKLLNRPMRLVDEEDKKMKALFFKGHEILNAGYISDGVELRASRV